MTDQPGPKNNTPKIGPVQASPPTSNTLWGARFSSGPAAIMQSINASIDVDQRLWRQDIAGSRAHAAMLAQTGIITAEDASAIDQGLNQIAREIEHGQFTFSQALEDIHLHIESRLSDLIGAAGRRLHTARSRNDQVATDLRLWLRDMCITIEDGLKAYQIALLDQAERHAATIMPGFTHLQTAQPITFGHHLMAYVEMAARDCGRFSDARVRLNECPLGAAALAGTRFPIDREMTARDLGFSHPMRNSLDAVASRDCAIEFLGACAIAAGHLSRLAEEIVLWMSPGFSFIRLSDAFTTGSSIMPQKRNPDAAELVRAKAARIAADHSALLGIVQSLPLAYAKDLQEDKALIFQASDNFALSLAAMTGMVRDMQAQPDAMRRAAALGYANATDLADWLVAALGLPFRDAHHATGHLVALAEAQGAPLEALSLSVLQSVEPRIDQRIFEVLALDKSAASRNSFGGTAPIRVREQIAYWREHLK